MPFFMSFSAAALLVTLSAGAPQAVTRSPSPEPERAQAAQPRVEIGPAVLTIYGASGEVVSVE